MTLTPTKREAESDWWQASRRFFDGVDDMDPPIIQRDPSLPPQDNQDNRPPNSPPSSFPRCDGANSPPSSFLRYDRANSPRSPSPTRPTKMPRIHSSHFSPQGNHVTSTDPEIAALRDELRSLRDIVEPLQKEVIALRPLEVEVRSLREEVSALRPLEVEVRSLREEITALRSLDDAVM